MECVAAPRPPVVHAAVRVLRAPPRATAAHPVMEAPASVKLTLPVGLVPVTDAVKVTFVPTVDGLSELTRVVVDVVTPPGLTTCVSVALVDPLVIESPV